MKNSKGLTKNELIEKGWVFMQYPGGAYMGTKGDVIHQAKTMATVLRRARTSEIMKNKFPITA